MENKGRRYNKGKLRYELISSVALKELAKVYTNGAEKYTDYNENGEIIYDGANNWRKGLSWMDCIASAKRHIEKFMEGIDIDDETNTFHLANAAWNIFTILDFYKTYPQGDDRIKKFQNIPKIGLDIDEVLADWVGSWMKKYSNIDKLPGSWYFDLDIKNRFDTMIKNGELDEFYLNLEPLIDPLNLKFEPYCYITSRPVDTKITEKWLEKNGFPLKPVYTVPVRSSKLEVAKQSGIDIFIDDSFENFVDLNKNGICTYLYTRKHNKKYNVGHLRINDLNDLPFL